MEKFIVSESQNGDALNPQIFATMTEAYQYYTDKVYQLCSKGYKVSNEAIQDCRTTLYKGTDKVSVLLTWHV